MGNELNRCLHGNCTDAINLAVKGPVTSAAAAMRSARTAITLDPAPDQRDGELGWIKDARRIDPATAEWIR